MTVEQTEQWHTDHRQNTWVNVINNNCDLASAIDSRHSTTHQQYTTTLMANTVIDSYNRIEQQ